MRVTETSLPEVLIIEPEVHTDSRGFFFEAYNDRAIRAAGITANFVQDNQSSSARNVLRGLHYQIKQPQGKLIRVIRGEAFDVAVDVRKSSPYFGRWVGMTLSAENKKMTWIPPGFAHGFLVLSDVAEFIYKTTDYWAAPHDRCIVWNDPDVGIRWPHRDGLILSAKDQAGKLLKDAEVFP